MKKCFLVTGGNGYIGSHMCKLLSNLGQEVVVIDSYVTSPKQPVHSYGVFYRGDVGDRGFVNQVLSRHSVEAVFHFAARSVVAESEAQPFMYFCDNSQKSTVFLQSVVEHGIKNIIFSSTSSVYGTNTEDDLLNEGLSPRPENAYALSKKLVEDTLEYLTKRYSLNVGVLRYFNVAGSDPTLEIGENHEPETHLIPNLCLSYIKGNQLKFKLFGDQHPTPDGTCIRDYIHVCDLVRAHWLCYEYMLQRRGYEIFNLGSGVGFSVLEVLKEVEAVVNSKIDYDVLDARPGDPPRLVCDIKKAHRALGFENEYNLRQCIATTLDYLRKKAEAPVSK